MNKTKKSQSEMVGFVLIVVIVVVAIMVFLIISVRKPAEQVQSTEIENLLSAMMEYTTECAIVYEPDFDSMKDLIKSCVENKKCNNLDQMACDYLDETSVEVMASVMATESQISAYEFEIYHEDESNVEEEEVLKIVKGKCEGRTRGAREVVSVYNGELVISLKFCYIEA